MEVQGGSDYYRGLFEKSAESVRFGQYGVQARSSDP